MVMMFMMNKILMMLMNDDDAKCAACWGRQGLVRHGHHLRWVNVIIVVVTFIKVTFRELHG